jgi:hypothetical protein
MGAQIRRAQQPGKMQTQHSTKRKKSKKDRQYPAPPARSEAGGLGISEEFVDFLLDQGGSSLRSWMHASVQKEFLTRIGIASQEAPSLAMGIKRPETKIQPAQPNFAITRSYCITSTELDYSGASTFLS